MSDFVEPIITRIETNEGFELDQRPDVMDVCEKLNELIERYNALAADYLEHLQNEHNINFSNSKPKEPTQWPLKTIRRTIMECNVVSLETAKLLKAAKFPQENPVYFWNRDAESFKLWTNESLVSSGLTIHEWYAAPTAQEIADHLTPALVIKKLNMTRGYKAMIEPISGKRLDIADGKTMAEALAQLYIKLNGD